MTKIRCPKCRKKIYYMEESEGKIKLKCNNCNHTMLKIGEEVKEDGGSIDNTIVTQQS